MGYMIDEVTKRRHFAGADSTPPLIIIAQRDARPVWNPHFGSIL